MISETFLLLIKAEFCLSFFLNYFGGAASFSLSISVKFALIVCLVKEHSHEHLESVSLLFEFLLRNSLYLPSEQVPVKAL